MDRNYSDMDTGKLRVMIGALDLLILARNYRSGVRGLSTEEKLERDRNFAERVRIREELDRRLN
ncbi:MAG: hypothetical protein IIA87_01045 [Nanoarchaeota archaeon]|nr:hypothetical protein [Nanoarchaeota archaeon]